MPFDTSPDIVFTASNDSYNAFYLTRFLILEMAKCHTERDLSNMLGRGVSYNTGVPLLARDCLTDEGIMSRFLGAIFTQTFVIFKMTVQRLPNISFSNAQYSGVFGGGEGVTWVIYHPQTIFYHS